MNILHKFLLGASLLAVCACSQSEILTEGGKPETDPEIPAAENTRELVLQINNTLQIGGGKTKAPIASEAENQIKTMDIYLFGSENEEGPYTFMEHLAYRSNLSQVEGATSFELITNSDNSAVSNAILNVTKGLYVKLYCVANQPDLFTKPAYDGVYPEAEFSKLTLDTESKTATITKTGTPTETVFQNNYLLRVMTRESELLTTPLPMVGNVPGPIDLTNMEESARLQTNLKLTRAVSRFDIANNAEESGLTISAVGMEGGFATTTMFPMVGQTDPEGERITYPVRTFEEDDDINTGTQLAAYYSYAAPADANLVLIGKYTTPGDEEVDVAYKVPFNGIKNQEGVSVAIQPNHRYTVTVNEADPYEIKLSIEVADWEEGGDLDDYDPSKANEMEFSATKLTDDLNSNVSSSLHTINTASAGGKGTVKFKSNSDISIAISYAGGLTDYDWLSFAPTDTVELAGQNTYSKEFTFTATVKTNATYTYPPATVVFSNKTGAIKMLTIHSRQLATTPSNAQSASILTTNGDPVKKYLVIKNPVHIDGNVNWTTAMAACPEEAGWRLPSMNDLRHIIAAYNWDSPSYLSPGTKAYKDAFDNKTYSYNGNPTIAYQYKNNGALAGNFFIASANYWTSDINPENGDQAGYFNVPSTASVKFVFTAKTTSFRVRCIKDWK